MTTKTILTDKEIIAIGNQARAIEAGENGFVLPITFARAIERAVLQSPEIQAWKRDSELLSAIESECWDIRYGSTPNADAGDATTSIEIVGHFMDKPNERVIGEDYNENLRAALEQAMTADAYPPARPEYGDDAAMEQKKMEVTIEEKSEELATYIYNSGYMAGHQDTVEGQFTDIHSTDMDTYHADVVSELVNDNPAAQYANARLIAAAPSSGAWEDEMKELKTIRDLLLALLEGYEIERYFEPQNIWESVDSVCFDTRYLDDAEVMAEVGKHRIKPAKPSINWDHVHPDFKYLARDKYGEMLLFKDKPKLNKSYLDIDYWLSESQFVSAMAISSLDKGTCDWRDSLIKRPEY